jgi:hypothetical protein
MKVTLLTRQQLAHRRAIRDLERRGYEKVGDGGGRLWELYRGDRIGHHIIDAVVAPNGLAVYVKIVPKPDALPRDYEVRRYGT